MAVLDTDTNEIVLRIVYDGPPEAGKTTSMRALASSLAQPTITPEEDATGRTLWFDWMEYVGGRFEGNQIRCQIVSVPGQSELLPRRTALVKSADVVVFVADSTAERWDISVDYLGQLRRLVAADGPPVGIVLQANKRDAPTALSLAQMQLRLGDARWNTGLVESVAADGTGLREAFVYAVRLALDRVRELVTLNQLPTSLHAGTSPAELLAAMQRAEQKPLFPPAPPPLVEESIESLAAELFKGVIEAEARAIGIETVVSPSLVASQMTIDETIDAVQPVESATTAPIVAPAPTTPLLPDAGVPSGAIWPPVEGRAILYEVAQQAMTVRSLANGDWRAGLGSGWRIMSTKASVYESLDLGRAALVQWARLHSACLGALSPHRCIVLAATGTGEWRLWQIVRAEPSLRDYVVAAASEPTPDLAVHRLCHAAELLVDVHERIADMPCELPCSLDTIGQADGTATFIGLMPPATTALVERAARVPSAALIAAEIGPVLALDLADVRVDLGRALERIPQRFAHAEVVASLSTLLA